MVRSIVFVCGCALAIALLLLLGKTRTLLDSRPDVNGSQVLSGATEQTQVYGGYSHDEGSESTSLEELLVLHRQKRYLLFPEGSSFQLVFDLIIPIADYTNFAILGITCAVAWELPSKPPSELVENLRTRLNDGTLGTVRRNDSIAQNVVATDRTGSNISQTVINWQPMHAQPAAGPAYAAPSTYGFNVHSYPPYYSTVGSGARDTAYANSPNGQPHARGPTNWHARQSIPKWQQWGDARPAATPATGAHPIPGNADRWTDNWWQHNRERVQQKWLQKQQQWQSYGQPPKRLESGYNYVPQRTRQLLQEPPKHHIYPVFGRRRRRRREAGGQPEEDDVFERLQLRQHLRSRGLLFAKIERLYKSRRLNGTACIQRALCESAQRFSVLAGQPAEPQSFIMELVSAIFQLPSSIDGADQVWEHIPAHFLEAHREQGSCSQIYGDCSHTFWQE